MSRPAALPPQAWPLESPSSSLAFPPGSCVTSRNKAHLSAHTCPYPKMGSTALLGRRPGRIQSAGPPLRPVLIPWEGAGKAGQASGPWARAGGRGDPGLVSPTHTHLPSDAPTFWPPSHPTPKNPCCPPRAGVSSLLAGFLFCWFMLFLFFQAATQPIFLDSRGTFLPPTRASPTDSHLFLPP